MSTQQRSNYLLGHRLARGGMAEIFLGKLIGSEDFQRICAIKRILPHYAAEREYLEMFRTEANICKRLQHANIAQVHDFIKMNDTYAIVMEYVDGIDLRALLAACEKARVRLSIPMAVYIAAQAARGLHYAHTRADEGTHKPMGIVHRDISPQNVLVSYEGEVKIIDFGIAKFASKTNETKPGVVKGKYSYMSPEQVTARDLDARTDVFSLCIVLWEALAMRRLFAGDAEVETIRNVQNGIIRWQLPDLNADVDGTLHELVMRGLHKDRKKRYQSAAALEKELSRYLASRHPDFAPSDLGNFVRQIFSARRAETQGQIKELLALKPETANADFSPEATSLSKQPSRFSAERSGRSAQSFRSIHTGGNEILPLAAGAEAERSEQELAGLASQRVVIQLDNTNLEQGAIGLQKATDYNLKLPNSKLPKGVNAYSSTNSVQKIGVAKNAPSSRANAGSARVKAYKPVWTRAEGSNKSNSRTLKNYLLMGAIVSLAVLLVYALLDQGGPFTAKGSIQVYMTTDPSPIAIAIDGEPKFDGRYQTTPLTLPLESGRHRMQLTREGFQSLSLEFQGKEGATIDLRGLKLKPDPRATLVDVKLDLRAPNVNQLYVELSRGIFKGLIPAEANHLVAGKEYTLIAFPNFPANKDAFKCSFTPQRSTANGSFSVTIDLKPNSSLSRCIVSAK